MNIKLSSLLLVFTLLFSTLGYAQNNVHSTTPKGTILVLGDSLSAGYGLLLGEGWVDLLKKKLEPQWTIQNASISGETSDGGKRRIDKLLSVHQPKVLILELGANDGLRGFPPKITYRNLEYIILQSQKINAKILLAGIHLPPNYGEYYENKFYLNFQQLSKKYQTTFLPFILKDIGGKKSLMQNDGLHPKALAQPIIIKNIMPYLEPLLLAK